MENKSNQSPKAIPYNAEAERSVLGSCLIDGQIVLDVTASLSPSDFYLKTHQKIFEGIHELYNDNKAVDVLTVQDFLNRRGALTEVGGLEYLISLSDLTSSANFSYYVDIVKRDSTLRSLISASNSIAQDAYNSVDSELSLSRAEKLIFDLSRERDRSSLVNINTVTGGTIKEIEDLFNNKESTRGIKSHFSNFDHWFNGLHRSDLILIAARPGVGKTSFALNLVSNVALQGKKKVVVFSLEMPKEQLSRRLLCSVGQVSMSDISSGNVDAATFKRLHAANKSLTNADIFVDDSSLNTPSDILSKCRRFIKEKGGLDLVMIDYLQLMSLAKRTDNRQQEISELTRSLKIIAKELNVPILLLSQLSRALESRSDKRPMLSDLRESGAIEQDADIVMFIHKADLYDPNAEKDHVEMIVAKHRNGRTGSIYFKWVGEEVSFVPVLSSPVRAKPAEQKQDGASQPAHITDQNVSPPAANISGASASFDNTTIPYDLNANNPDMSAAFSDFNADFVDDDTLPAVDAFDDEFVPPEAPG